jgi:hypothetical protein
MTNIEEIAAQLADAWGAKTLSEFRNEAAKELNGTAFVSLRTGAGPRHVLAFCLTGEHEIAQVKKKFKLVKRAAFNWKQATLPKLAARAMFEGGFIYDAEINGENQLTALVLMSTDPRSIAILEKAFNLPP